MKPNRNSKLIRSLVLGAGTFALAVPALEAASFTYNDANLILAFRQVGGSSPDLIVNIGPASTYDAVPLGSTIVVTNLSTSQLNLAFSSLNSVNWSVSGAVRTPGNPAYPVQTIWATAPRTTANVQSKAWLRKGQFAQGGPASVFAAVGNNAATYASIQPAGPNNTATGLVVPNDDPNAYTVAVKGTDDSGASDFGGVFQGNIENSTPADFDTVEPLSRSDFYKLIPGTSATATIGSPAALSGYFDFTPDGTLTFTAGPSQPPRPGITAIQKISNVTTVSFTTTSSATYRLRFTDVAGLASPVSSWSTNGVTLPGNGSVLSLQDTNAAAIRFYAVEALQ